MNPRTIVMVTAVCSVALAVALAGCTHEQTSNADVEPTPSKYGTSSEGFEAYRELGRVFAAAGDAASAVDYPVAGVGDSAGRVCEGAVLVERFGPEDPEIPAAQRPLYEFYGDFRFEQWPFESAEEAAAVVEAADASATVGVSVGEWDTVAGNRAFVKDRVLPDEDLDGTGEPSGVASLVSSVTWAEGTVVYKVRSEQGIDPAVLLRVARSVHLAAER